MGMILHCGARNATLDQIRTLPRVPSTKTYTAVQHDEYVDCLKFALQNRGVSIQREEYGLNGTASQLFGVFKLNGTLVNSEKKEVELAQPGYAGCLGFRNSTDKTLVLGLVAGANVTVCDNMVFSGSSILLSRKHRGKRHELLDTIRDSIGKYADQVGLMNRAIAEQKRRRIRDRDAKMLVFNALATNVIPEALFGDVHRLYFADEVQNDKHPGRTLWGLNNAFTEAAKSIGPNNRRFEVVSKIGGFFERLVAAAGHRN